MKWTPVKNGLPDNQGVYRVKCNDGAEFDAMLGAFGQWRHIKAGLYADLYENKNHPDWIYPGGGSKNIQKRRVTHYLPELINQ